MNTPLLHLIRDAFASEATDVFLMEGEAPRIISTPEAAVHNEFRRHRNHFRELEEAAEGFWGGVTVERDEVYVALKQRLRQGVGVQVRVAD